MRPRKGNITDVLAELRLEASAEGNQMETRDVSYANLLFEGIRYGFGKGINLPVRLTQSERDSFYYKVKQAQLSGDPIICYKHRWFRARRRDARQFDAYIQSERERAEAILERVETMVRAYYVDSVAPEDEEPWAND